MLNKLRCFITSQSPCPNWPSLPQPKLKSFPDSEKCKNDNYVMTTTPQGFSAYTVKYSKGPFTHASFGAVFVELFKAVFVMPEFTMKITSATLSGFYVICRRDISQRS